MDPISNNVNNFDVIRYQHKSRITNVWKWFTISMDLDISTYINSCFMFLQDIECYRRKNVYTLLNVTKEEKLGSCAELRSWKLRVISCAVSEFFLEVGAEGMCNIKGKQTLYGAQVLGATRRTLLAHAVIGRPARTSR